ncbi:LuxR C-terminal-related transcriptional regulator [Kitasatospora sp. HPMI-4]|uniref:LuxR C-terminal-related transcriptional regulator n=1 Tax=Kitasatospora sp. HPMI-4 TaxID=3448443 RepID=UPI003F1BDF64
MQTLGQQPDGEPVRWFPPPDSEQAVFWRNRAAILFDRIPLPLVFCDAEGTIIVANHAMATEWGVLPGRLTGRNAMKLFRPTDERRLDQITEAVRLRRTLRYPVEITWSPAAGSERHGEMTIDVISDAPDIPPNLLLILHVVDGPAEPRAAQPTGPGQASDIEARVLALAAGGATSTRIATELGLTADGVNYHLTRLSRRWGTPNRTSLVARAYVKGVLAPHAWPPEPTAPGSEPTPPA